MIHSLLHTLSEPRILRSVCVASPSPPRPPSPPRGEGGARPEERDGFAEPSSNALPPPPSGGRGEGGVRGPGQHACRTTAGRPPCRKCMSRSATAFPSYDNFNLP